MVPLLLARFVALACLVGWAALLTTPYSDTAGRVLSGSSLLGAGSPGAAAVALARLLLWMLALALRFAPLGALAVFTLPDQEGRLRRAALVLLPALGLATLAAWVVLAVRAGTTPGPFELALPALGILLGAYAGLAWRRGWGARLLFLPRLLAQAAVLTLLAAGLAVLALEPEPVVPETTPLSSAEKRELVGLFEGKNPRRIPRGESRTLRLSGPQLERLAQWLALSTGARVRPSLHPETGGLSGTASLQFPRIQRWLNVRARALASIEQGRLAAEALELRIGQLRVPALLLRAVSPFLVAGLQGDRDLRRVLPAVERLAFTRDAAVLSYTRVDMPPGLVARLVWGEEAGEATRAFVHAHVDRLLLALGSAPSGDLRFARALETAFAAARDESGAPGSAVEQNRAAILALGIVLGQPRLAHSLGGQLDDERAATARELLGATTLRGRNDWVRHFTVSGALTVLGAPGSAAGLLKEELDADGGSGFSFADLMADRAGVTFAEAATRDEESARAVQQRLAGGFRVDEFFPPAADLPENIPAAELQSRYGGVGGELYRKQVQEIERRISDCLAYRQPAEAP